MTKATVYWSLFDNSVFNALSSCTAILLNIATIHALRKTLLLPQPLRTLLVSLAVSDLGVGLLVQPLFTAYLVVRIEQNIENNQTYNFLLNAWIITGRFLVFASMFGIVALSADRFLAIHLHLRYQELVTHKRVVAVVISIWAFSAFLSLLVSRWTSVKAIHTTTQAVCVITTALFYSKIYTAVRRHSNQIQALQVQQVAQNGEVIANAARKRKSAIATFYVYLVFLACYLPNICINIAYLNTGLRTFEVLSLYTKTLVHLNSSLNTLIYCWKMKHVRHAIINILRNILPSHN